MVKDDRDVLEVLKAELDLSRRALRTWLCSTISRIERLRDE